MPHWLLDAEAATYERGSVCMNNVHEFSVTGIQPHLFVSVCKMRLRRIQTYFIDKIYDDNSAQRLAI